MRRLTRKGCRGQWRQHRYRRHLTVLSHAAHASGLLEFEGLQRERGLIRGRAGAPRRLYRAGGGATEWRCQVSVYMDASIAWRIAVLAMCQTVYSIESLHHLHGM